MDPTFTAWKRAFSLQETCMVYVPARYGRFLEGRKTLVHEFVHHGTIFRFHSFRESVGFTKIGRLSPWLACASNLVAFYLGLKEPVLYISRRYSTRGCQFGKFVDGTLNLKASWERFQVMLRHHRDSSLFLVSFRFTIAGTSTGMKFATH